MFSIKIKHEGKWTVVDKFHDEDKWSALDAYNGAPVPKMLTIDGKIIHRQYSDNGFLYVGERNA